jgi:hypothetical protein
LEPGKEQVKLVWVEEPEQHRQVLLLILVPSFSEDRVEESPEVNP